MYGRRGTVQMQTLKKEESEEHVIFLGTPRRTLPEQAVEVAAVEVFLKLLKIKIYTITMAAAVAGSEMKVVKAVKEFMKLMGI
jgi:hypothetical protein